MMRVAGLIIHLTLAGVFGACGAAWIAFGGYGFWGGVLGFICGIGIYCAMLMICAIAIMELFEWLDRH